MPEAIRKGNEQARKNLFKVPLDGTTIPHRVDRSPRRGPRDARVRPAPVRASSPAAPVRAVVEVAGIRDILTKCIGTSNPHNVVHATLDALRQLESIDDVAARRGKTVDRARRLHRPQVASVELAHAGARRSP